MLHATNPHRKLAGVNWIECFNLHEEMYNYHSFNISSTIFYHHHCDVFHLSRCYYPYPDIVKLLLEHNCDLDMTSKLGRTALHLAVWNKRTTVTRLLLKHGCCTNHQDQFSDTPLMLATLRGYTTLVKAILRTSHCDVHVAGPEKDTALHFAARHGRSECIRVLCKYAADVDRRNMWGLTPLHLAVTHGNASASLTLIRVGADINATDRINRTLLHYAVKQNITEVVLDLLLKGAKLEVQDFHGNRPLVEAILFSDLDVLALMVRANCDLDATGSCTTLQGHVIGRCSPVEVAVHRNRLQVAELLIQAGCDVTDLRRSIRSGVLASKMEEEPFRTWVRRMFHEPQSLTNHCRRTLIKYLRTLPLSKVNMMTVPPGLVDYLNYGDILRSCKPASSQTVFQVSRMQILVRH